LWTDSFSRRTLAIREFQKNSMLLPDPVPNQQILKFGRWLGDRLPDKAIYDFPFDKAFAAFNAGRTIKLSVTPVGKRKHSVELWIED
jgi:hypothetical protein